MKQRTENIFPVAAGLVIAAGFMFGVIYLFALRFQSGDVYPAYSSYRSDPLGTKALFESLSEVEGLVVERNHDALGDVKLDPDTVIFFLGDTLGQHDGADAKLVRDINMFIGRGGRLVVTLLPRNSQRLDPGHEVVAEDTEKDAMDIGDKDADAVKDSSAEDKDEAVVPAANDEVPEDEKVGLDDIEDDEVKEIKHIAVNDWLGVVVDDVGFTNNLWATIAAAPDGWTGLPERVSCHSSIFLTDAPDGLKESEEGMEALVIGGSWDVIYERDGNPVVVEKKYGKGSVVLSALTYFVSNEAMREERYPELISWMIGRHSRVVFDEYHLGIMDRNGVMDLARKYRLHWFIIGLLLLGVLFVWKNSVGLVPPLHNGGRIDGMPYAEGKDTFSGLVNLLRRNIPQGLVVGECLKELKKSVNMKDRETDRRLRDMEDSMELDPGLLHDEKKLVSQYNRLAGIWTEKRRYNER